MAAFFRFVSLIGVVSAGLYVLYLTQARLTEPESLTQQVSEEASPVTLGAEGDITGASQSGTPWKTAEAESPALDSAFPGGAGSPEMFSTSSNPASTEVAETEVTEDDPFSGSGLDFRDANVITTETPGPGLGIVSAVATNPESSEIVLASNENPFAEDATRTPNETESPAPFESSDPFDAQDPFDPQPEPADKPTTEPETKPGDFDPFGEDVKEPEPFTAESAADAFPALEPKPASLKPTDSGTQPEPVKVTPDPFATEDPFSPFAEETEKKPDETAVTKPAGTEAPTREPAVSSDPFGDGIPEFPEEKKPAAPKPEPDSNPFGEPFPELGSAEENPANREPIDPLSTPSPASDPFGETPLDDSFTPATPAGFPEFPGELSPSTVEESPVESPAKPLESGVDPFAEETPATKPAENTGTAQPAVTEFDEFPAFEPGDAPVTETPPERTRALPGLDEFPDLDEALKKRVTEDAPSTEPMTTEEPAPEFSENTPKPLPSLDEKPSEFPADDPASPENLRSAPIGIVPSLTDLQGDGVVPPETPRKVQLPYLEIHKSAPPKAILNQPFVYTILVKNVGDAAANEVTVQDQIPKGANLTGTIPQAELVGRRLVWELGRIEPGEEQKVAVRVVPIESGPIGSVATVNFVAEVGAETVVEQPEVTFRMTLPRQADVGDVIECRFEIENQGSKVVSGIVLRDIIPEGLHHPDGNDLENPLGDLKPGDKILEALELKVMKPGDHINQAVLTAEGGLEIKQQAQLEATGNRLVISRRGPKERFVGRPAVFQNVVKNSSQEAVRDAVVIEKIPAGMQFVQAGQGGQYHAASREIYWKIAELKPGQSVSLDAQMTPVTPGVGESLVRVRESQGKEIETVSHTQIRSYASIGLEVTEFDQPVLIGDTVVMRVEATNRGNAAAQTVQLRAKIPPTLQLMSVRGKTRFRVEGREVVFETLQALPAGATEIIELELEAAAAAKAEVSVSVQSQGMPQPLVKAAAVPVHSRQ